MLWGGKSRTWLCFSTSCKWCPFLACLPSVVVARLFPTSKHVPTPDFSIFLSFGMKNVFLQAFRDSPNRTSSVIFCTNTARYISIVSAETRLFMRYKIFLQLVINHILDCQFTSCFRSPIYQFIFRLCDGTFIDTMCAWNVARNQEGLDVRNVS